MRTDYNVLLPDDVFVDLEAMVALYGIDLLELCMRRLRAEYDAGDE